MLIQSHLLNYVFISWDLLKQLYISVSYYDWLKHMLVEHLIVVLGTYWNCDCWLMWLLGEGDFCFQTSGVSLYKLDFVNIDECFCFVRWMDSLSRVWILEIFIIAYAVLCWSQASTFGERFSVCPVTEWLYDWAFLRANLWWLSHLNFIVNQ